MSNETDLIARVNGLYQAFGRGDVAAIAAVVSENVWWGYALDYGLPGVPAALGPYRGRDGVRRYFAAVTENLTVKKLAPVAMLSAPHRVAALIDHDIVVTKTGRSYAGQLVHLFEFDDSGLINRHVHFDDTAAILAAYRE